MGIEVKAPFCDVGDEVDEIVALSDCCERDETVKMSE